MQLQKKPDLSDRGASETIGAVMLISVVVLAVAIIGVALTSQGTPQQIPALDAVISNYGDQIQIYHNGGDTLQKNEIEVWVDGSLQTDAFHKGGAAWTFWSPGESLVATFPSPKIVRIVYKGPSGSKTTLASADFSPGGMSNPGPVSTSTLQAAFSSSPSSGTPPLVVQFTDLSTGSPAGYNWAFGDGGTSGGQNPTHVFGSSGTYTVSLTVTNSTGSVSSTTHTITVSNTAPSVISTSPATGTRGTSYLVHVYGTGFVNGATFRLHSGSTDLQATSVVFGSSTTLSGTIAIPAGSATGAWDVVVTNPDTQTGTLTNGFTVTAPTGPPTVSTPTPGSGATGSTVFITNLPGTNFQTGAQVKLNSSSASDISAANITVVSPIQITCTFYLSGAATGARNVVVTNPDGQAGMQTGGFTVSSAVPAPVTADFNGAPTSGTIPFTVQFVDASTGSPATWSWSFGDTGTSTLQHPSHTYSTAGTYTVTLQVGNGSGLYNTSTKTGYVIASPVPPMVTSVSPVSGNRGWTINPFTVQGSGFKSDATVVVNNSGSTLTPTGCTVTVPSSISCTALSLSSATAGTYNVVVTNTADTKSGMSVGAFTVNNPTLSITALYPNTARRSTAFPLAINGNGFKPGASLNVVITVSGRTVTATGVNAVTPNWITCSIPAGLSSAGTGTLTLTNGDGVTTTSTFTVT